MAAVSCSRCGRQAEGLAAAPLAGPVGQEVLARVCADCWRDWTQESFRLINHYGLQPVDPSHRERLRGLMREYFRFA